jgi:hypothetical protein
MSNVFPLDPNDENRLSPDFMWLALVNKKTKEMVKQHLQATLGSVPPWTALQRLEDFFHQMARDARELPSILENTRDNHWRVASQWLLQKASISPHLQGLDVKCSINMDDEDTERLEMCVELTMGCFKYCNSIFIDDMRVPPQIMVDLSLQPQDAGVYTNHASVRLHDFFRRYTYAGSDPALVFRGKNGEECTGWGHPVGMLELNVYSVMIYFDFYYRYGELEKFSDIDYHDDWDEDQRMEAKSMLLTFLECLSGVGEHP